MDERGIDTGTQGSTPARREFRIHLTIYLVVMAVLIAVNLLITGGYRWFVWPLLGWGIGVLAHAATVFGWFRSG